MGFLTSTLLILRRIVKGVLLLGLRSVVEGTLGQFFDAVFHTPIANWAAAIDIPTVITVTPFDGDSHFNVNLVSSDIVGQGLSGTVTKGVIRTHGRRSRPVVVALKVFQGSLSSEEGHRELYCQLYRNELGVVQTLGAMRHYILPFLGTAVLGNRPVLVSIFMRNGNLLQFMERHQVNRQGLVLQVAEALTFLHKVVRIVHGDLKCENILVSENGKPLLSDFGLSTHIDKAEENDTTVTAVRECNSVRFAAPELLTDEAELVALIGMSRKRSKTPKSDVWAFGMVMLQAFTGKHPWPETGNRLVAHKILTSGTHPRPGIDAHARGLTDEWWAVCLKCWRVDPCDRPRMGPVFRELNRLPFYVAPRMDSEVDALGSDIQLHTIPVPLPFCA